MKIYLVGGSVRDKLLHLPPRDTDFLVVDALEADLLKRGLVKVGQTFPIYLDPENGDEYTLGKTLAEDLSRRDLTINAMALDENNLLTDLYGGEKDLEKRVLRHVSRENFFEDPLRVLRAARFLSQLPEFSLHPETLELMKEVTAVPEYKRILPERMIKELKRVFGCERPSRFFETLKSVKGMDPYLSEVNCSFAALDEFSGDEERCFSFLVGGLSLGQLESLGKRLNVQTNWMETARAWVLFSQVEENNPEELLEYFYRIDAFRKPRMVEHVASLDKKSGPKLLKLFSEIKDLGIADVSPGFRGKEIGDEIRRLRLVKLRANLSL